MTCVTNNGHNGARWLTVGTFFLVSVPGHGYDNICGETRVRGGALWGWIAIQGYIQERRECTMRCVLLIQWEACVGLEYNGCSIYGLVLGRVASQ